MYTHTHTHSSCRTLCDDVCVCGSFMKVMDRQNALQDAPCLCQETGRQVTLPHIHTHTRNLTNRLASICCTNMLCVCVCVGHVGPPLPCNYVKLVDVAEMSYSAARGEGEVSHRRVRYCTCMCVSADSLFTPPHPQCSFRVCFSGVCERTECVSRLFEGPGENGGGLRCGRLAAHGRHRQMASGKIPRF